MKWKAQCRLRSLTLGLDESGELYLSRDGGEMEPIRFNQTYAGYYPSSYFTSITAGKAGFAAAGRSEDGSPCLYTSLLGSVWERRQLMARDGRAHRPVTSEITAMLWSEHLYLGCGDGWLVTLPDCPRCGKMERVTDRPIIALREIRRQLSNGTEAVYLSIEDGAGEMIYLPVSIPSLQVSYQQAVQGAQEGYLIDLREEGELTASKRVKQIGLEDLPAWLARQDRSEPLYFLCEQGIRAQQGVLLAHKMGFQTTYWTKIESDEYLNQ